MTLHEARISQTGSHDRVLDLGSNTLHIDVSGPVSFFLLFSYLVILINFITSFFRGKDAEKWAPKPKRQYAMCIVVSGHVSFFPSHSYLIILMNLFALFPGQNSTNKDENSTARTE